jgi:hypothetical protein
MKNLIRPFFYWIQSARLYVFNLLTVRRVQVKSFEVRYETEKHQLRTAIFWDVSGCYRIKIKAYSVKLPGNIKGVSLKYSEEHYSYDAPKLVSSVCFRRL